MGLAKAGAGKPGAKPGEGNVTGGPGTALVPGWFLVGSRVVPAPQGWARPPPAHACVPAHPRTCGGARTAHALRYGGRGAEGGGRARDSGNATAAPAPPLGRDTPLPPPRDGWAGLAASGELGTGGAPWTGSLARRAPGVRGLCCAPRGGRSWRWGRGVWAPPRGCERGRAQGRQIADFILLTLTRVPGRSWERPWSGGMTNTYGGVPASGGGHGEGPTCWGRALLQNLPLSSGLGSRSIEQAPSC